MKRLAVVLAMVLLPAPALAQISAPPPAAALAPLLYVRLTGPAGSKVTIYPGTPAHRRFDSPQLVGLRPGYGYRVQLGNLARYPGLDLYPTFVVKGSLIHSAKLNAAEHPAPIVFDDHDLDQIAGGAFVTKVIYLEHPEKAIPSPSSPDLPLGWEAAPGQDPMELARQYGRPVLILQIGQRTPTAEELLCQSVPETVHIPGEAPLGRPPIPPTTAASCFNPYDPTLGPRLPVEECLPDGGDVPPKAAFGYENRLQNVDPTDTVAEYKDNLGQRKITPSNRICICAPRFVAVRAVLLPTGYDTITRLRLSDVVLGQELLQRRTPPLIAWHPEQLVVMVGRDRTTEAVARQGLVDISQMIGTAIIVGRQGMQEIVGMLHKECEKPPCPLVLRKRADKNVAQIGDIVTITLTYTNPGGQPINDVAIVDSLTGRLEYVIGSQKSDRPALFSLQANEAGSVKLRWEIRGALQQGQTGTVTFQVKVR